MRYLIFIVVVAVLQGCATHNTEYMMDAPSVSITAQCEDFGNGSSNCTARETWAVDPPEIRQDRGYGYGTVAGGRVILPDYYQPPTTAGERAMERLPPAQRIPVPGSPNGSDDLDEVKRVQTRQNKILVRHDRALKKLSEEKK